MCSTVVLVLRESNVNRCPLLLRTGMHPERERAQGRDECLDPSFAWLVESSVQWSKDAEALMCRRERERENTCGVGSVYKGK